MAGVETKRIYLGNVSLTSSWTSQNWKFTKKPTTSTATQGASFTVPSGATILDVILYATPSDRNVGGMLTVNGSAKRYEASGQYAFDLGGRIANNRVNYSFKASGDTSRSGSASITFTSIHIDVRYYIKETVAATKNHQPKLTPPPRDVYIYSKSGKKTYFYMFDGVTQIQHNNTVSIEESPEKNKERYVNNAKNEPDKIVLDVIMSDVYGEKIDKTAYKLSKDVKKALDSMKKGKAKEVKKAIKNNLNSRSSLMFQYLLNLKETRAVVTLITPQYIYTDMIVSSITANQNADYQFGWEGQVSLQGRGYMEVESKGGKNDKKTTAQAPTPSLLVTLGLSMR